MNNGSAYVRFRTHIEEKVDVIFDFQLLFWLGDTTVALRQQCSKEG